MTAKDPDALKFKLWQPPTTKKHPEQLGTHELTAVHPSKGPVGKLQYIKREDHLQVETLRVPREHRGNGYAGHLMDEMQRRHPGTPINHGSRTDAGQDWWDSYSQGKDVTDGRTMAARQKHEIPADGPMTLRYVRNPGSSKSNGNFGEQYGQHVEPHGRYLSERSGDHAPEGWETGEVHFHNPLHVPFGGGYTEPSNWKHQLSDRYDGKRGKQLSKAVAKDGHDAIVTHDDYGTSEIVDLTHLHKRGVKEPNQRLFGKTFGLDKDIFEGERLRSDIRADLLGKFDHFCRRHGYMGWRTWGKLVFFGSEASEWTSESLEGNGDFDLSFGIEFPVFLKSHPQFAHLSNTEIAQMFTDQMHAELNDPGYVLPSERG